LLPELPASLRSKVKTRFLLTKKTKFHQLLNNSKHDTVSTSFLPPQNKTQTRNLQNPRIYENLIPDLYKWQLLELEYTLMITLSVSSSTVP
jgi:hypothetical protein